MNFQFDSENLLAPISADQPAGIDLRNSYTSDSLYQQAKEERMQARVVEREQSYAAEAGKGNQQPWLRLAELAQTILKEQSKDLEVCVWLIEAQIRLNGFQGLAQTFALLRAMLERYWDSFYPVADPDDQTARFAALTGLNGEANPGALIAPLYQINITDEKTTEFTLWDYLQAQQKFKDTSANEELAAMQNAAMASGKQFARQLYQDVTQTITEFQLLCALLEEKLPVDVAPPSSRILETLLKAQEMIAELYHAYQPASSVETTEKTVSLAENNNTPETSAQLSVANIPSSRQQAFQQLQRIADFFKEREPNSPVPFLLERAINWGNLSLPELLAEMVQDQNSVMDAYRLIGVTLK